MKLRSSLALALVLALCVGCAGKEEPQPVEPAVEQAKAPEMTKEEMMAKWQEAATPGDQHKLLEAFKGRWKTTTKIWHEPNAEPEVTKGTAEKTWIMGKRFLKEDFRGKAMGKPFNGMGLLGYDNSSDSYVSIWLDNFSTGVLTAKGNADPSGKVFTFTGEYTCPMTGKPMAAREVLTVVDNKTRLFELFHEGPDGKEMKTVEVTYTK